MHQHHPWVTGRAQCSQRPLQPPSKPPFFLRRRRMGRSPSAGPGASGALSPQGPLHAQGRQERATIPGSEPGHAGMACTPVAPWLPVLLVNKRRTFLLLPGRGRGGGGDSGKAGLWQGAAVARRACHWWHPSSPGWVPLVRRGPSLPSTSLTWEDGEASGRNMMLGCLWAGELEASGRFGKGRRCALVFRQPGFLKHPSCCQ